MKRLIGSILLVYAITNIYLGFLSPYWGKILENPLWAGGLIAIAMWVPGIIGLIFARKEGISLPVFTRPNRYFFLAPLLILVLMVLAFVLSLPFVEIRDFKGGNLIHLLAILPVAYFFSLTGSMLFALGEELYWRGYFWEKLRRFPPIKSVLIMGALWGIWHWPFVFFLRTHVVGASIHGSIYPGSPVLGSIIYPFYAILLSFPLTYYRLKGKSIMTSAAMHGMISLGVLFVSVIYQSPSSFLLGMTGVTGLVIALLVCLFLKLFSPSTWKKLV